ncbi:hypothetical protein ACXIVH_17045, partial [Citrobacter amalonaticus]
WLMMSLWDALRMNMMISYQELVRTFLSTEAAPTTNLNLTGADGQVYIPLQATSADISQNFVARYESYDATPITPGNAYADMTVNILYR